jgi:putative endonuclease
VTKTESSLWIVYLIETDAGLYCGITTDMDRRYQQHCNGTGAKFFRRAKPIRIAYTETQPDRSTASKREYAIKQLTRKQKLVLVNSASLGL